MKNNELVKKINEELKLKNKPKLTESQENTMRKLNDLIIEEVNMLVKKMK
ncbi:hypothetical protein HYO78_gp22 [Lactococcus phage CaseusJM1]|uniref:Uncharacterized protein n=2 Tax=Skunavirus TaxID=1623305 RepID=A0A126HAM4_9CAUD|nr:hypothetical protein HYO78_gp22 [Lactococcus phage CaseusJM1]AGE60658.1 hypothetical protein [Lactococcus phage CaseusJM1]ALM63636.1 hypothetical protein PhiF17_23 [Lactococcus phage 936 group phage PhiF.17]UYE98110.1 MAG: hypothetical protein [Lactococcus phage NR01]